MLYSSLVALLLGLAAAGVENLFGRLLLPRRGVWAAALAGSIVIPIAAITRTWGGTPIPEAASSAGLPTITIDPLVSTLVAGGASEGVITWALLATWATLSAFLIIMLLRSLLVLRRERATWEERKLRGRSVWISSKLGPAVFGVRRPGIVLPAWVLTRSESTQELILSHEEEHIRAHDLPLLLAGTLIVILFPWNLPLIWQVRRLRQAVELDCDRRVLSGGFDPVRYGRLLLEVDGSTAGRMMVAALIESPSLLERRIRAMLSLRGRLGVGALVSAMAAVIALAAVTRLEGPRELAGAPVPVVDEVAAADTPPVHSPPAVAQPDETVAQGDEAVTRAMGMVEADHRQDPYSIAELDSPPSLLNVPEMQVALKASYPGILQDAGISGRATVEMTILPDGTVEAGSIRVLDPSDDRFIEPARSVAEQFRFSSPIYQGTAVSVVVQLPLAWQP